MLKFGLVVNPLAGIGGAAGLKGSDAVDTEVALARGGRPRGEGRCARMLTALGATLGDIAWLTWGGAMGARCLLEVAGEHTTLHVSVVGTPASVTSANDTVAAARALQAAGVDLLVFVGGDGTARDIVDALGDRLPVLGVPAGVKMHSGVFATTPETAAEVLQRLVTGGLVSVSQADVRDIDERALRRGEVNTRFYGELTVPEVGGFLQRTKEGGRENEGLALQEIAAEIVERLADYDRPVVLGPGGTVAAVKTALAIPASLLGVDVWRPGAGPLLDVDAATLEALGTELGAVIVSFTRRQGFLLGRGNQQISPAVLRRLPREKLWVVGSRSKLLTLDGRPLLVDTDDPILDRQLSGLTEVIAGYDDRLVYRVGTSA